MLYLSILRFRFFFILTLLFCVQQLVAQNSPYRFNHLSVDEGLTQNSVWSICRDKSGLIWIGTADGLNMFNGHTVQQFKYKPGFKNGISGHNISIVKQDKFGQLWIGSEGGIDVYNIRTNQFKNVFKINERKDPITYLRFLFYEPDSLIMWYNVVGVGMIRINTSNQSVIDTINLPLFKEFDDDFLIGPIGANKKSAYMKLNGRNVLEYEFKTNKWTKHKIEGDAKDNRFYFNAGYIYYSVSGALFRIDTRNWKTTLVGSLGDPGRLTAVLTWMGNVFLCTETGYSILHESTGLINHYRSFSIDNNQSYNRMAEALMDETGTLWLGTDGRGIFYTSVYTNKFLHLHSDHDDENMVKGMQFISNDKLAAVAYMKGILIYDLKMGTHKLIGGSNVFKSSTTFKFGSICKESDSKIWICATEQNGNSIHLVDINNETSKDYTQLIQLPGIQSKQGSTSTFITGNKKAWYVVNLNSVVRITPKASNYTSEIIYSNPESNISMLKISEDSTYLFIGTNTHTITYNLNTREIYRLSQDGSQLTKCVEEDKDGNYYVGTNNGIFVFDQLLKPLTVLNTENGLPDNFVYGILRDEFGKLWISHNRGVSCYNHKTGKYLNFDVHDGLQSNEFNTASYCSNGKLLCFGGINGISVINPRSELVNPYPPNVVISAIKLFDDPLITDTQSIYLKHLKLPYYNNTISFEFTATDYADYPNNQYEYFMEGYDAGWIESGTKHFARYANLPPGKYRFKVRASNADGIWNNNPTTLEINITPPFWQTIWFEILAFIFIAMVIAAFVFLLYRRQQLKVRREQEVQRKLDQERIRISRDLHDHVGAQLSYLVTNIEWMKSHPDHLSFEEEVNRLGTLEDAGRQAILTLRQTIWAISQHELSMEEFADRFKQYALKMIEFSKHVHVQFHENIEKNCKLSPAVALNLFRICQESFNNAVKHSNCTTIKVSFICSSLSTFCCIIEDDGIGFEFEKASANGHYGLHNMKARSEESGAELSIQTSIGKGCSVKLELKKIHHM